MKEGETYLSGNLDLGALGKAKILVFKNNKKKNENSPTHRIMLSNDEQDNLKQVGVLWLNKKKSKKQKQESVGF